jgi:hypothetical protein
LLIFQSNAGFATTQNTNEWQFSHPFVVGTGGRDFPAEIPVTKPEYLQDPKVLFGGFCGFTLWVNVAKMANARIALNNIRIEGDKIKWVYNTINK